MSNNYPEHEKLKEIAHESQAIGEFIDWLTTERRYTIAEWSGDELFPMPVTVTHLLADYFGIDVEKIETEKRAMLDEIRS